MIANPHDARDLVGRNPAFQKSLHILLRQRYSGGRLDGGDQLLAKFGVWHAKYGAIADPIHTNERLFNLGWIDVYSAGNDHVRFAVGNKQEGILIEITYVAGRDKITMAEFGGLFLSVQVRNVPGGF